MAILKVSEEKVGHSTVVNIDTTLDHAPVFPSLCPCCVEPIDLGAFIVATCNHLRPVNFPACKVCARHTAFFNRVSRVMGPISIILPVLTVAGVLLYRGMDAVEESGGSLGWQVFGGIANLSFPFLSPINAMVAFLGGALALLAYAFVYWVAMAPVSYILCKPTCKWFNQAARTSRVYSSETGGYFRRFIFANPKYSKHFRRANRTATDLERSVSGP
jgi:hypothetical protein